MQKLPKCAHPKRKTSEHPAFLSQNLLRVLTIAHNARASATYYAYTTPDARPKQSPSSTLSLTNDVYAIRDAAFSINTAIRLLGKSQHLHASSSILATKTREHTRHT